MGSYGGNTELTTTRKQLRGYGATPYLSRKITEALTPIEKSNRGYRYALEPTISAIRDYAARSRVRVETKQTLENILRELLARLSNVVALPLGSNTSEGDHLSKALVAAMQRSDKSLAEMKATVASIGNLSGRNPSS